MLISFFLRHFVIWPHPAKSIFPPRHNLLSLGALWADGKHRIYWQLSPAAYLATFLLLSVSIAFSKLLCHKCLVSWWVCEVIICKHSGKHTGKECLEPLGTTEKNGHLGKQESRTISASPWNRSCCKRLPEIWNHFAGCEFLVKAWTSMFLFSWGQFITPWTLSLALSSELHGLHATLPCPLGWLVLHSKRK